MSKRLRLSATYQTNAETETETETVKADDLSARHLVLRFLVCANMNNESDSGSESKATESKATESKAIQIQAAAGSDILRVVPVSAVAVAAAVAVAPVEDAAHIETCPTCRLLTTAADIEAAWAKLSEDDQYQLRCSFSYEFDPYLRLGHMEGPCLEGYPTLWKAKRIAGKDIAFPECQETGKHSDPAAVDYLPFVCFFTIQAVPAVVHCGTFHVLPEATADWPRYSRRPATFTAQCIAKIEA